MLKARNVLFISDLHAPYHHPSTLRYLKALNSLLKPELVISVGDEVDQHALSRHPTDPDLLGAGHELKVAAHFLDQLERLFPKLYLCESNHGARYLRRAMTSGLPEKMIRSYQELWNKPKWQWAFEWIVKCGNNKIVVSHGMRQKDALRYARNIGCSTVQGHYHSLHSLQFTNVRHTQYWGMQVGCLADPNSRAVDYAKEHAFAQVTGLAALIDGEPRLIRMPLNSIGQWTGKVVI